MASQPSKLVSDNHIKLGSSLNNILPLPCGDIVCNLSTIGPIVHHQNFQLLDIVDNKLLETIG